MEYGFSTSRGKEYFHSKSGLTGSQVIVESYSDSTITHKFNIVSVVKTDGDTTWYEISNHNTVVDKTPALYKRLEEQENAILELAGLIGVDSNG